MQDLDSAQTAYVDYLSRRAQALRKRARLEDTLESLRAAADEHRAARDALKEQANTALSDAVLGNAPESALDDLDSQIRTAEDALNRRRQMLELAEGELARIRVPSVDEGRTLLDEFCTAATRDLLDREQKKKFDSARQLLTEAFGIWSFVGGDWDLFLSEFLPAPSDEEIEQAREAFGATVKPIEEAAQGSEL